MTDQASFRWTYEAALEKSDLKPMTRWLLNRIAARADAKTGMISLRYMPSVTALVAATGMSERNVQVHLRLAEQAGWLVTERRSGRKSGFALKVPGTPDVSAADTIATPADIPPTLVDNAPAEVVDNTDRGADSAPLPPQILHPVQTFAQTKTTVDGSGRRSPYVRRAADPESERRSKILGEFAQGRLYSARSDVPDCRPSAVRSSDLCRRCGGYTCGEHCQHLEEPLTLADLLDWSAA